ncbi:MAG: hypothetical protein ACMG6E_00860 [Candidatus Roizmanbacteria bacterium]
MFAFKMEVSELLASYQEYEPSEECYLDGRYFRAVLGNYEGLVHRHLHVVIKTSTKVVEEESWKQEFQATIAKLDEKPIQLTLDPNYVELLRVIVEVEKGGEQKSRHSNLLIFNNRDKKIMRFEPLATHKYHHIVNDLLKMHFAQYLPTYTYSELALHPQHIASSKEAETNVECESKGMCVAFVTKLAAMISVGAEVSFSEDPAAAEEDIRRFAEAIKQNYEVGDGKPDIEYGPRGRHAAVGGVAGALLGGALIGGLGGVLLGGAVGAGLGYGYNPGPYPYQYYSPPPVYYYDNYNYGRYRGGRRGYLGHHGGGHGRGSRRHH